MIAEISATTNIWIVEDHDILRKNLQRLCSPVRELNCAEAFANAEAMLLTLAKTSPVDHPQVMLMDVGLPGRSGLEALARIRKHDAALPVLIITAHGSLQNALHNRLGEQAQERAGLVRRDAPADPEDDLHAVTPRWEWRSADPR